MRSWRHTLDDMRARNTLATVLELDGKRAEALKELRTVLARRPDYATHGICWARFSWPKEQLRKPRSPRTGGAAGSDDPNIHYQLGQAYQRLGKSDLAAKEFEVFQQLKAKSRGDMP